MLEYLNQAQIHSWNQPLIIKVDSGDKVSHSKIYSSSLKCGSNSQLTDYKSGTLPTTPGSCTVYACLLQTLSLPVIVTVHGNQECQATATYLWDNQFSEQVLYAHTQYLNLADLFVLYLPYIVMSWMSNDFSTSKLSILCYDPHVCPSVSYFKSNLLNYLKDFVETWHKF